MFALGLEVIKRRARSLRRRGGIAQLGERLPCKQEVSGSIPLVSTTLPIKAGYQHLKISNVDIWF